MPDKENTIKNYSQTWPMPQKLSPIIIIGTGGIVKAAHLPAYKKAGFEVNGLYDVDLEKAKNLAKEFGINNVFNSLEEAFQNKSPVTLENELENYQDLYVSNEILGRTFINNILFKSKFKLICFNHFQI